MTEEQIVKALELCLAEKSTKQTCGKCPYHQFGKLCKVERSKDALELINRKNAEIEDLIYKLVGVMHSVDKWLDGNELKGDEVQRAAIMREKTLQITERQQAEIKREHEIVEAYAQAARTIELYLKDFCNKQLPYDEMIADASRKASAEIEQKDIEIDILIKKKDFAYDEVAELSAEIERLKEAIVSKNLTPIEYKVRKEHDERHIHIVNGLKAEVERLNKEVDRLSQCVMYHDGHIVDAIKEFAKFLVDNKIDVVDLTAEFLRRGESECHIKSIL